MKRLTLSILFVLFAAPAWATTYYLAPASGGGSDSNNGLTGAAPWLTPSHALNCGDTILAAVGTYDAANFQDFSWGKVACSSGNGVVWLQCATFAQCIINATGTQSGMWITGSYWAVQGWRLTTASTGGACLAFLPSFGNITHNIAANNVVGPCGTNGISSSNVGTNGADYTVFVGNFVYNAALGSAYCASGISIYQPIASDSLPGTHIYIAGNFVTDNVDPDPCGGGTPTDGEGISLDTLDGSQGSLPQPYNQQVVVDNNIAIYNGNAGLMVNGGGTTSAPVYFRHNTSYGNHTDSNESSSACGQIVLATSPNPVKLTQVFFNLSVTQGSSAPGCANNPAYAYYVFNGGSTDQVFSTFAYSVAGSNTGSSNSTGFSFGPNNMTSTNPSLANPVDPGALNCGSAPSVPNCMAAVIANFTPQTAAASPYGYQKPSTAQTYDPLFPQWLCNANLPAGLVTMGCVPQSSLPSSVSITGVQVQ